jgi:hypothetical protein
MEPSDDVVPAGRQVTTFIVRLSREDGRLTGVVERVRSGEKVHVDGVEDISRVIGRMIGADTTKGTAEQIEAQGAKGE